MPRLSVGKQGLKKLNQFPW